MICKHCGGGIITDEKGRYVRIDYYKQAYSWHSTGCCENPIESKLGSYGGHEPSKNSIIKDIIEDL